MTSNTRYLSRSLLIFLSVTYCRISESEAILKGEKAQVGEFPSIVSLRNETGKHYCGGTLVSRRHIVTAAHCLYDEETLFFQNGTGMLKPENLKAVVGTLSSKEGGDTYEIEKLIKHPKYDVNAEDLSLTNDVGVIVLKSEVNTKNVVPASIPDALPKAGDLGIATGWGLLTFQKEIHPIHQIDYATDLQKLQVKIQDKRTCIKKFKANKDTLYAVPQINTEYLICGQPVVDGASICVGDSGSPLTVEGKFVGFVVGGVPCGKGYPDFYASAAAHQDFIRSVVVSWIV